MKICIFNVKYSPNLGDGLLAECLEHAIIQYSSDTEATFSVDLAARTEYAEGSNGRTFVLDMLEKAPTNVRREIVKAILQIEKRRKWKPHYVERMAGCDGVVIGGGNLFTDMDMNFPVKIATLLEICARRSLPVAIYGVGVGAQWSKAGKALVKKALKSSQLQYVSVRDENSKINFLRHFADCVDVECRVVRDPGILASNYLLDDTREPEAVPDGFIGVNVISPVAVRYHSDMKLSDQEIFLWYQNLISALQEAGGKLQIFTNGSPEDIAFCKQLMNGCAPGPQDQLTLRPVDPENLTRLIARCRLIVGFRMHALIAGYSCGKHLVALGWDPKVKNFMTSVGLADDLIDVSESAPEAVAHKILDKVVHDVDTAKRNQVIDLAFKDVGVLLESLKGEADGLR